MGRTVPTFNTFLQNEEKSWRAFRRNLRSTHEKQAFDELFTRARMFTAECTAAARPVPFDAILMGILLSQELEIQELRETIERLRQDREP